jgi:hypothetical protein
LRRAAAVSLESFVKYGDRYFRSWILVRTD